MKNKFKLIAVLMLLSSSAFAAGDQGVSGLTKLFSRLSDAGVDQVVELPYNRSLVSQIGKQVKIHNIVEMQDSPARRPEPKSLDEEFASSFEYHSDRKTLSELSYKVGRGDCEYMEAVKVSNILVCYRKARVNSSVLAPVSKHGPKCTTANEKLSHCYIFAHGVDEVLKALSTND